MKNRRWLFVLILVAGLLGACSGGTAGKSAIPTPDSGNTNVIGKVVSKQDGKPVVNTIIRLAEVYRQGDQGAYLLDEAFSPGAYSNDQGEFQILNIKASEYVLVIGDPKGTYEVVTGDDGKARTWTATADQTLDMGTVKVEYQVAK